MRPTSAEMMPQGLSDIAFVRIWLSCCERHGGDDHTVQAVAALGSRLFYKSTLNWMEFIAARKPFQGDDMALSDRGNRNRAGANRSSVNEYCAGPAFAESAPVFRPIQRKVVSQDIEERRLEIGFDPVLFAIDMDFDRNDDHRSPPAAQEAPVDSERYVCDLTDLIDARDLSCCRRCAKPR